MRKTLIAYLAAIVVLAGIGTAVVAQTESDPRMMVITAERDGTTVNLSWPAVPEAVRYSVFAYHKDTGWEQLGGENLTETSVSHTDATLGYRYYYTGRAVFSDGSFGPWAEYVSVTIPEDADSTAEATPTATPTATPEAEATPDLTESCTLIGYAPADQPWPTISVPLIGNATMANYRSTFGENLEYLSILQVEQLADGYIMVLYYESLKYRLGAEFFRGCNREWYAQWVQLDYGWWLAYEDTINEFRQDAISRRKK